MTTRKRNRLPLDVYREPGTYFVTLTTQQRRPWFRQRELADHSIESLRQTCAAQTAQLIAYCFMPDHVHFLLSFEEGDLIRLVKSCKQRTGWWFRNRYAAGGLKASPTPTDTGSLWQRSFYDHCLRNEESIADVVGYILQNPVRAGIAAEIGSYRFAWSMFGPDAV